MAVFEDDIGDSVIVKYDNKEFVFRVLDGGNSVELTFVRTLFRKSSDVSDLYSTVNAVPTEVTSCLKENGYSLEMVS